MKDKLERKNEGKYFKQVGERVDAYEGENHRENRGNGEDLFTEWSSLVETSINDGDATEC